MTNDLRKVDGVIRVDRASNLVVHLPTLLRSGAMRRQFAAARRLADRLKKDSGK